MRDGLGGGSNEGERTWRSISGDETSFGDEFLAKKKEGAI